MRKALRWTLILGVAAFLGIQLEGPARTNPPVSPQHALDAHVEVPQNVRAALVRACFDCHSNQTRWPWYSHVAPVSWFVTGHVNHGRRHLNFDEWDRLRSAHEQEVRYKLICRAVQKGSMPLTSYRLIHWSAKLSPADIEGICSWTQSMQKSAALRTR